MKQLSVSYVRRSFRAGALAILLTTSVVATTAHGGALPGRSSAFSKDLAGWMNLYWQWLFGAVTLPQDRNDNAVVGDVVLLPLPPATGDGTPASLDVTLKSGQAFVMPLFGFHGTSYSDGTPPDGFEPRSIFETLELEFRVDGKVIMDSASAIRFYTQSLLDPPIPYDAPPLAALINQQSVGLVHTPLKPGAHVLELRVRNTEPAYGFFGEFNNTWNVTVVPGH